MKYLKYFEQASAFEAYKNGSDYVLPNVSYVESDNVVYYNPYAEVQETRLVCTYNVTDTTSATYVCSDTSYFTSMEVDGVLLDSVVSEYAFNTVGEHTIKFELDDPITIGEWVFYECSSLTSINIPNSVTSIGDETFAYCSRLTSIVIPDSVTSIGYNAFYNCEGLTSIVIPDSVTSIGSYAFSSCTGLTSVNIPDSVKTIEYSAFAYCTGLTEVHIGSGVTSIGHQVFYECSSLTSIVISEGNKVYDSRENCNCIIETATNTLIEGCNNSFVPDSVTSIGDEAFEHFLGLTSLNIGSGVTTIGENAFNMCTSLTSIVIPDSVTTIGKDAFRDCKDLTSVHIGSGVTSIGENVFNCCSSLYEITCNAMTPPTIDYTTFYEIKKGGVLKVPAGSDYSSWMRKGDYYLGKYNWTVEYI